MENLIFIDLMCMVKSIRKQRDRVTHLKSPGLDRTESEKICFMEMLALTIDFFCIHICSFSTLPCLSLRDFIFHGQIQKIRQGG